MTETEMLLTEYERKQSHSAAQQLTKSSLKPAQRNLKLMSLNRLLGNLKGYDILMMRISEAFHTSETTTK